MLSVLKYQTRIDIYRYLNIYVLLNSSRDFIICQPPVILFQPNALICGIEMTLFRRP